MRIQNYNSFAQRPSEPMTELPKYFLIYEGESTEPVYFDGIIVNRNKLAINQKISIISVLRSLEDLSKSHPKYALALANDIQKQSKEECITKENLLKSITDIVTNEQFESGDTIIEKAREYINNYTNDIIYNNEIANIVVDIFKNSVFEDITQNILEYLELQKNILDYNSDIDVINLIIDRDSGSFKDYQYESLVNKCKQDNINLYVSNPCFEVWLLMHFEEFESLDFNKLLENKRINGSKNSRKYSDKMLSDIIGYDKSNLKFEDFVDKIDEAIEREKKYCESLDELKSNVGSNVGILIENMRN